MRIKILTVVYILILAGIIVLADLRGTQYLLNFVRFIPYGDKVGHFFLMGIFSFLLNLTMNAKTFRLRKINFLLGTLIVLIVVTIEEFSQKFVRGRTFDLSDLVVDFAGILVFGELARLICRKFFSEDSPQKSGD